MLQDDGNGAKSGHAEGGNSKSGKATIELVAREAGVSLATVSRVVNGTSPYISQATRLRVEEAIERLHYTPNRLVRSLQTGRSDVIAYISLEVGPLGQDEFVITMLHEVCRAASIRRYDVLVPVGSVMEGGLPSASALMDGRCDAVILSGPQTTSLAATLVKRGFPTVILWSRDVPPGAYGVAPDNSTGVRKAMEYLLSLGHRRIAHLAGPVKSWDCAQWRLDEYAATLKDAGIAIDGDLISPHRGTATWAVDVGAVSDALDAWMSMPEPPTAVFCASDRLAVTLISAAAARGIKVPDDLSVVGFDDVPMARHSTPPLTTISTPLDRIAAIAVETAVELIGRKNGPEATMEDESKRLKIVDSELVIRLSTAPPRR